MVCSSRALEPASLMPNGLAPTYAYKPPSNPAQPVRMRGLSTRRGRAFIGGTYFRSIDPGRTANNITVQIVKEGDDGYLIVTNRNLNYQENVLGPAGIVTKVLDMTGSNWNDLVRVEGLDGVSPRAQTYSISCYVAFQRQIGQPYTLPAPTSTVAFPMDRLVSIPGKLAVKIEKSAAVFTPSSVISIAPRFKIYKLLPLIIPAATDPATGVTTPEYNGYDIPDMRAQVNAAQTWIEMLERSGTPASDPAGPPAPPLAVKFDEQDDGLDDKVAMVFAETNLEGGDGLPDNPTVEKTGPYRSIVFINYGEKYNGSLGETNTVYEWVGSDAVAGEWKAY